MKVEVFKSTSPETIETYSVPNLSLLDFQVQEWVDEGKVEIDLNDLSNTVDNLNLEDSELSPEAIDFYLPDSLTDSLLYRLVQSQTEKEESGSQSIDKLNEIRENISRPALRLRTVLSAVVTEILQNHFPYSEYKVRISDG